MLQVKIFLQLTYLEVEEPIMRRDAVHGAVNSLPDPNYATLRVVAFHLSR